MCRSAADVADRLAPLARRGAGGYGMLAEPGASYIHERLWDEYDDDAPLAEPEDAEAPLFQALEPLAEKPALAPLEQVLGPTPLSVDELARASGWTPAEIRMRLQELELEDRIERHSGDRVSLRQR
jgi:DNA processing protein